MDFLILLRDHWLSLIADALVILLMVSGTLLFLLAAVGIVRMRDVYTRMQAASKAGSLGVACMVMAVAMYFKSLNVAVEATLVVLFIFLTTPIATHLIARAGYFVRVPIWERTARDELEGCYDAESHTLQSEHLDQGAAGIDAPPPPGKAESQ
ncbi:MAG: monovalent cation/H(+) antiporter subunit G [Phycisphaerales bacterium]|nr:MAG: monovalent cation/H(+) antiporter subunit G [Phycisphaerales bacterium]